MFELENARGILRMGGGLGPGPELILDGCDLLVLAHDSVGDRRHVPRTPSSTAFQDGLSGPNWAHSSRVAEV